MNCSHRTPEDSAQVAILTFLLAFTAGSPADCMATCRLVFAPRHDTGMIRLASDFVDHVVREPGSTCKSSPLRSSDRHWTMFSSKVWKATGQA
ncbi:MAG: hypothetical protein ACRYGR_00850 [Janthinobacterium lividum]